MKKSLQRLFSIVIVKWKKCIIMFIKSRLDVSVFGFKIGWHGFKKKTIFSIWINIDERRGCNLSTAAHIRVMTRDIITYLVMQSCLNLLNWISFDPIRYHNECHWCYGWNKCREFFKLFLFKLNVTDRIILHDKLPQSNISCLFIEKSHFCNFKQKFGLHFKEFSYGMLTNYANVNFYITIIIIAGSSQKC